MKNLNTLKEDWAETKKKLKQKLAILTENDLLLIEGKYDEVVERLRIKLGKTKEEILKLISEL